MSTEKCWIEKIVEDKVSIKEAIKEAVAHYAEEICSGFHGIPEPDMPLFLTALNVISKGLKKKHPEEAEIADIISSMFGAEIGEVCAPMGTSKEEIGRLRKEAREACKRRTETDGTV